MKPMIGEGTYACINILREKKVYNLYGIKHFLDDDYNNDMKSSIYSRYS